MLSILSQNAYFTQSFYIIHHKTYTGYINYEKIEVLGEYEMSNLNEAEDYKLLSFETNVKLPEETNENDIIKFNETKVAEQTATNSKNGVYHYFKRAFDITVASIGLVVLSPLLLATSIAIKIDSKGPAIYKQKRIGKDGKEFEIYKFRSMAADNDASDLSTPDKHTKVGDFIRKTSIDELPQLVNILKGDMAIIGPRPWTPVYYQDMTEEQKHRYDVLPGITGLAQASGRNCTSVIDRINYDLEYVENYNLKSDIDIIFKTLKVIVCKQDGADGGKGTVQADLDLLRNQHIQNVNEDVVNKYTEV